MRRVRAHGGDPAEHLARAGATAERAEREGARSGAAAAVSAVRCEGDGGRVGEMAKGGLNHSQDALSAPPPRQPSCSLLKVQKTWILASQPPGIGAISV